MTDQLVRVVKRHLRWQIRVAIERLTVKIRCPAAYAEQSRLPGSRLPEELDRRAAFELRLVEHQGRIPLRAVPYPTLRIEDKASVPDLVAGDQVGGEPLLPEGVRDFHAEVGEGRSDPVDRTSVAEHDGYRAILRGR